MALSIAFVLWEENALQIECAKLEPLRSETEHATSRSRSLSKVFNICELMDLLWLFNISYFATLRNFVFKM